MYPLVDSLLHRTDEARWNVENLDRAHVVEHKALRVEVSLSHRSLMIQSLRLVNLEY